MINPKYNEAYQARVIGINIKTIREEHNDTQTILAEQLGVSKSVISAYEKGIRRPSLDILDKLSRIYHVDVAYFLEDKSIGKHRKTIDVTELTPMQIQIIRLLVDEFEEKNKKDQ